MHRLSPRYALPAILLILVGAIAPTIRLMTDLPAAATGLSAVDTRVILHVEAATLRISFLVALATTALATCVSLLIRDLNRKTQRILLFLSVLPVGVNIAFRVYGVQAVVQLVASVPGLSAISTILFTERATIIGLIHWLYPIALMMIFPSITGFDESLLDAARLSGASSLTTLSRIVLPILTPALSRTSGITFVLAYGAFITPAALGGPGDITVSRLIGSLLNEGRGRSAVVPALVGIATPILCLAVAGVAKRVFIWRSSGAQS
jgi:ABC-type spermidine/putrescine transport system permease subunit I